MNSIKNLHPLVRFLVWKDCLSMHNAAFLMRRPHRSFKRTYRRDYIRSLKLPGYWAFTVKVWQMLWRHRRIFGLLLILYTAASLLLGGITNQDTYQQISDLLNKSAGEVIKGTWGSAGQAGLLLFSVFMTPGNFTAEQQIYLVISGVMLWLATVWLLREIMAGRKPRMRDGLYSSGSPIIASVLVLLIGIIQLIPIAVAALVYAGLATTGLLTEGLGMMLFWSFAVIVVALVLYWMTPTFIALVIVTLPGMYPLRAMRAAGDIVIGRRLRILYRLLWMLLIAFLGWMAVMIPVVLFDTGIKNAVPAIKSVPIVPVVAALMSSLTAVWASAYIYMLYRRVVDDDASPA